MFFTWYNQARRHVGLGRMTLDQVHYGQADEIHAARQITLNNAFEAIPNASSNNHPNRPQADRRLDQLAANQSWPDKVKLNKQMSQSR